MCMATIGASLGVELQITKYDKVKGNIDFKPIYSICIRRFTFLMKKIQDNTCVNNYHTQLVLQYYRLVQIWNLNYHISNKKSLKEGENGHMVKQNTK